MSPTRSVIPGDMVISPESLAVLLKGGNCTFLISGEETGLEVDISLTTYLDPERIKEVIDVVKDYLDTLNLTPVQKRWGDWSDEYTTDDQGVWHKVTEVDNA